MEIVDVLLSPSVSLAGKGPVFLAASVLSEISVLVTSDEEETSGFWFKLNSHFLFLLRFSRFS